MQRSAKWRITGTWENYLFYVGTSVAPWTGGFNTSVRYKGLTLSVNGNFSLNAKVLNNIESPASYSKLDRNLSGVDKEPIPNSKYDLYVNHLNVVRDVTHRWTPDNPITDGYPPSDRHLRRSSLRSERQSYRAKPSVDVEGHEMSAVGECLLFEDQFPDAALRSSGFVGEQNAHAKLQRIVYGE